MHDLASLPTSVIGVAMSLAHHIGTAQRHTIAVHAQIEAGVLHRNQPELNGLGTSHHTEA